MHGGAGTGARGGTRRQAVVRKRTLERVGGQGAAARQRHAICSHGAITAAMTTRMYCSYRLEEWYANGGG